MRVEIQSILTPPRLVRIHIERINEQACGSVRAADNEQRLYAAGRLKFIHGWLTERGYRYVTGTRALWHSEMSDATRRNPKR